MEKWLEEVLAVMSWVGQHLGESVVWWSVRLMETRAWCPPVPGQWSGRGAPQKSNDTFVPERVALTAVPPALSLTTYLLPGCLGGGAAAPDSGERVSLPSPETCSAYIPTHRAVSGHSLLVFTARCWGLEPPTSQGHLHSQGTPPDF